MKFFLDENVNLGCLAPLKNLYLEHEFRHAYNEGLSGEKDITLFEELARQNYDAIMTKDRNQLKDSDERKALFDAGLHWIGHKSKHHKGLLGLAVESATVTAGLIYVLNDWKPEPHSYLLKGVPTDVTQRVKVEVVGLPEWGRPPGTGLGIVS